MKFLVSFLGDWLLFLPNPCADVIDGVCFSLKVCGKINVVGIRNTATLLIALRSSQVSV